MEHLPILKNLFVLDLANNHQGDVNHALKIIDYLADAAEKHEIKAGIKFQFRDLDSFIAPSAVGGENKHIKRFQETRLDWDEFFRLKQEVDARGLMSICTPFDEASVAKVAEMEFDILKIASCSSNDWPLLDDAVNTGLPMIVSTGGLSELETDRLVSFLTHKFADFGLMHCTSIYPTPRHHYNLAQIGYFRERYKRISVGWSTHESPDEVLALPIAMALGAEMFERHVGLETSQYSLNAYSSGPEQIDRWFASFNDTQSIIGEPKPTETKNEEQKDLQLLKRGVYFRQNDNQSISEYLDRSEVYFAFPLLDGQLSSGEWSDKIKFVDRANIKSDAPVIKHLCRFPEPEDWVHLKESIYDIKALLSKAAINLDSAFDIEFSHHFGRENFRQTGTFIINCINREYCKKILVQLPGQRHPLHHHRLKEETFQVLAGELLVELDGRRYTLHEGQTLLVQPGVWHSFSSEKGAIFEEISTTHHNGDSYYKDSRINKMTREERKTTAKNWGRFFHLESG